MKAKRLLGLVLLVCLIAPFAGTFLWLHWQKETVKKEVKTQLLEGVDRNELVILQFSLEHIKTELQWKHSREFKYKGNMYDIVETETRGDTITYWCWQDQAETKLNTQLKKLLAQAMDSSPYKNQKQKHFLNFCKGLYHSHIKLWHAPSHPITKTHLNFLKNNYPSLSFPPPSPPPQVS